MAARRTTGTVGWALLACIAAARAAAAAPSVHTAFCAECTLAFDWKSIGMFHSHKASGMPGAITRLLACSAAQLEGYRGLQLGPTFVHQNYGSGDVPGFDPSPTYNKPASLMHWLQEAQVAEEYIVYVDADMLLRRPLDVLAMGAKLGTVVSEHVAYLDIGIRAGLLEQFIGAQQAERAGAAGWYHILHADDARRIAPRWLHFCRQVRQHPERYWAMPGRSNLSASIPTGDAYVQFGQAPWIAEMYGYVLAAAEAGVGHVLTDGVVVYSDDALAPGRAEPSIIHYGLHCHIKQEPPSRAFHFTKYSHGSFDPLSCAGAIFPAPPQPTTAEALCAETVETLNDGLCAFYAERCGLKVECPAHQPALPAPCVDAARTARCAEWARAGECVRNRGFMLTQCRRSCDACGTAGAVAATPPLAGAGADGGADAELPRAAAASAGGAGGLPLDGAASGGPFAARVGEHERFGALSAAGAAPAPLAAGARMRSALRRVRQLSPFRPHGRALEAEAGAGFGALLLAVWALLLALPCAVGVRLLVRRRRRRRRRDARREVSRASRSGPSGAREPRDRRRAAQPAGGGSAAGSSGLGSGAASSAARQQRNEVDEAMLVAMAHYD